MTTYTLFTPPPLAASSPFGFQPTLDFQVANVLIPWSLFGRRWYFQLTDTSGNPIVLRSLVGSPDGVLNKKITTYLEGFVIVETIEPHGYKVLDTVNLTLSGVLPADLNGVWSCFITGPTTYRFSFLQNFSNITTYGRTEYNVNLVAGYAAISTLVFRESSQNFEVTP